MEVKSVVRAKDVEMDRVTATPSSCSSIEAADGSMKPVHTASFMIHRQK